MPPVELRVYIQNQPERGEAYQITPENWRAALGPLASSTRISFHDARNVDLDALSRADVCVGSGFDTRVISQHAVNLRLLHVTSAGVEKYLPLDWLPAGAVFTNSRGIHSEKAEQYALMALLMLATRVPAFVTAQREHAWRPILTRVLRHQQVTIVGLGNIGRAVAKAAAGLQLKVRAVTRSGQAEAAVSEVLPVSRIKEAMHDSRHLVLCCPLTPETRGLISSEVISALPRGAGLINLARGAVLDSHALARALVSGHLSGAILDVFEEEPLPHGNPLWDAPNLLVTPHVSCDEPEGYIDKALGALVPNLSSLLDGVLPTVNVVSRTLQY